MHRHAAVIGRPIDHSLSPQLHRAAYAHLGLPIDYGRQDLAPEELDGFLAACRDGYVGLSVTMPHKQAAAAAATSRSARVQLLGAANTLVWGHPEHRHHGLGDTDRGSGNGAAHQADEVGPWAHNTDVEGIVGALRFAGLRPLTGAETVGVVGNGGTASAAVLAASVLKAGRIDLFVRSAERAAPLVALARECGMQAQVRGLDELAAAAPGLASVVCTLPPRAADPLAEQLASAHRDGDVPAAADGTVRGDAGLPPLLDAAYDPWPSAIACAWQDAGGAVVSGVEMLLYQAVEQVRLFAAAAVAQGAEAALRERVERADWAEVTDVMARAVGLPPRH
ncbi:shikimate dehydrogenase [Micrococcus sp. FDAARGOS_333]|uniref:shikimate dehydrogenase family protein n=1 Tax=Micrococcus sp. FDAARGOS_333 TaxID=1930558 RepID=UPI000B4E10DB|nr:shikimate dehydrogenase [Micrococcus sp. FDAARGOS_333]PNL18090.1 shikimate dehydrogenase [Micrococcus sp. FDAARGOS_333]